MKCILCNTETKECKKIKFKRKTFEIMHCTFCDLEFYKNIKKTSQKYYEELYQTWNVGGVNIRGLIWGNKVFFKTTNKRTYNKRNLLLDIGCADGLFVREALRRGYNAFGIDINGQLIAAAHKYFGINTAYQGELPIIKKYVKEKFEYITFFDVLEHLENPKTYIRSLKKYIRHRGYIFVSLPNRKCFPRFLPIDGDLPPHHLSWWSEKSLGYLFEENGYKVKYYAKEPINPRDMAVGFDYLFTKILPGLKKLKGNVQQKSLTSSSESTAKTMYQFKKLELDILSWIFWFPAKIITLFGGTGTAQCMLVQLVK